VGEDAPLKVHPPDETAEAFRRVYVAARTPRLHWPFLPWFLLAVGLLLLAVTVVIDITEDRVPDGFVRTTGRVVAVNEHDCRSFERACDEETYLVAWTDTEGRRRDASFHIGVGSPEVGDPFDLRYQPEGPPRAHEMGEGYYFIGRTRVAAGMCLVAAFVAAIVNRARRRRWAARRGPAPSAGSAAAHVDGA
jgi:hypothetical protein